MTINKNVCKQVREREMLKEGAAAMCIIQIKSSTFIKCWSQFGNGLSDEFLMMSDFSMVDFVGSTLDEEELVEGTCEGFFKVNSWGWNFLPLKKYF